VLTVTASELSAIGLSAGEKAMSCGYGQSSEQGNSLTGVRLTHGSTVFPGTSASLSLASGTRRTSYGPVWLRLGRRRLRGREARVQTARTTRRRRRPALIERFRVSMTTPRGGVPDSRSTPQTHRCRLRFKSSAGSSGVGLGLR
jgi:hypothetical protein